MTNSSSSDYQKQSCLRHYKVYTKNQEIFLLPRNVQLLTASVVHRLFQLHVNFGGNTQQNILLDSWWIWLKKNIDLFSYNS